MRPVRVRLEPDRVSEREEYVRRLWKRFREGGIDALLADAPRGIVWEPYGAGERLIEPDELREFFASVEGGGSGREALIWELHEVRGHVLAIGSVRWPVGQGYSEVLAAWVFFFDRDGRLCRAATYGSPEEAGRALLAVEDTGRGDEPAQVGG